MQLFLDFLPIVFFFIFYKIWGIFVATAVAIVVNIIQVFLIWLRTKSVPTMQWLSLIIIIFFGGGTLIFHNPNLIKWKPTILYWLIALVCLVTQVLNKKPLLQRLMEKNITLTISQWKTLTLNWSIFCLFLGTANLLVAHYFTTNTWVNFKLFGILGLTLIYIIIQSVFLAKHITPSEK